MNPVHFQPFRLHPIPPALPQALAVSLHKAIRDPQAGPCPPSTSETLLGLMDASGLSEDELCERMQKPGGKTRITPAFLAKALSNDTPEMWLQMRILRAIGIPWEDYDQILTANLQADLLVSRDHKILRQAYQHYRDYGPRLCAMIQDTHRRHVHGTAELLRLNRLLKMDRDKPFDPPSVPAMVHTIIMFPETCAHPATFRKYQIGGFRYHRLPDEVHDFDLQGNILASGRPHLEPPPGLQIPQIHACCGGVIRTKKMRPPGTPKPVR